MPPMKINFENASRKFGAQVVFKNLSRNFKPGCRVAVLGGNGSGKSTFLKIVYSSLSLSSGKITHQSANQELHGHAVAHQMSFAGPYFELIEELPTSEFLDYYQRFRKLRPGINTAHLLERALLSDAGKKLISNFSSGMKQRLKLALALFSDTQVVILDEPTSNLDPRGMKWYQELMEKELGNRSLFVGSNFSDTEIFLCEEKLELKNYQ